jgi:tetratricopeptide (TPR) repeat protein
MDDERLNTFQARLKEASAFGDRRAIVAQADSELDWLESDRFEVVATRFSEQKDDTIDFARDALERTDLDRAARFLIFTMGVIACRRRTDRVNARTLFGGVGREFEDVPLFKHLQALSYDGSSLRDLKRGLELEREAYETIRPQAGAAHAIASFIVQIVEQTEETSSGDKDLLREALSYADEAVDQRPDYAKFYFTKGRIHRHLGEWTQARDALLEAVERENRSTADAPDRLRDYRLELSLVGVDQAMRRLNRQSAEATAAAAGKAATVETRVNELEEEVDKTLDRLQSAQVSVITAVAFVASAIGLVQVTARGFGDRPFGEVLALVAAFAVVLFGATGFGAWLLRRR